MSRNCWSAKPHSQIGLCNRSWTAQPATKLPEVGGFESITLKMNQLNVLHDNVKTCSFCFRWIETYFSKSTTLKNDFVSFASVRATEVVWRFEKRCFQRPKTLTKKNQDGISLELYSPFVQAFCSWKGPFLVEHAALHHSRPCEFNGEPTSLWSEQK